MSLARALVKNSKIIILDEATASNDNFADVLVPSAKDLGCQRCSVAQLALRVSSIKNASSYLLLQRWTDEQSMVR